jgi:hypothetical protein
MEYECHSIQLPHILSIMSYNGVMMNIYKARYLNALKKAARINRYIRKGYHVFHEGSLIDGGKFIMRDGELVFKSSDTFYTLFYQHDSNYDHGYWTKISEWNKEFLSSFEVYKPSAKIKL